jgi:hypothetical protein
MRAAQDELDVHAVPREQALASVQSRKQPAHHRLPGRGLRHPVGDGEASGQGLAVVEPARPYELQVRRGRTPQLPARMNAS